MPSNAKVIALAAIAVVAVLCGVFFSRTSQLQPSRWQNMQALINQAPRQSLTKIYKQTENMRRHNLPFLNYWQESIRQQCILDERDFYLAEKQLFHTWQQSWQEKSLPSFLGLTTSSGKFPKLVGAFTKGDFKPLEKMAQIERAKWRIQKPSLSRQVFSQEVGHLLQRYREIISVTITPTHYRINHNNRYDSGQFRQALVNTTFEIRGIDTQGRRLSDRGVFEVAMTESGGFWQIAMMAVKNAETLRGSTSPFFVRKENPLGSRRPSFSNRKSLSPRGYAMALGHFDNDEQLDLYFGASSAGKLYRGNGDGSFTEVKESGLQSDTRVKSAVFADFDNDGDQDLLLSRLRESEDGDELLFYKNLGGSFEASQAIFRKSPKPHHGTLSATVDFKGIIVIDNSPPHNLLDNANGIFHDSSNHGAATAFADYNNDGLVEVAFSNLNLTSSTRLKSSCASNWDRISREDSSLAGAAKGVVLYQADQNGKYRDTTESSGLNQWIGQGLAGIEFLDVNNDGLLDLYATNGLWSGGHREIDITSHFSRLLAAQKTTAKLRSGNYFSEDHSNFLPILHEVTFSRSLMGSILTGKPSMAGFQNNRLFLNNGDSSFSEIGFFAGADSIADGHVIAKADLNDDGKLDIILGNATSSKVGLDFPTFEIYLNQSDTSQPSLRLRLVGTESNRDGIGATVRAIYKSGLKVMRRRVANNGAVQSEPYIHFGIPQGDTITQLHLSWPSGQMQKIIVSDQDRHLRIIEPRSKDTPKS